MSVRYVWDKYHAVHEITEQNETEIVTYPSGTKGGVALSQLYSVKDGFFCPEGNMTLAGDLTLSESASANRYSTTAYPYAWVFYGTYADFKNFKSKEIYYHKTGGHYWAFTKHQNSFGDYTVRWKVISGVDSTSQWFKELGLSESRGDLLGGASSMDSSEFPNDGSEGAFWYVYKGSDSIDPTKLACSNPEPGAGETVTLTVTPRSNTYGGTIYYQYQYSANGGSTWKNIGSRTTSTTQTVQIPDDAEQFQARVLASDDWGFTSADYVYTALLEVSNGHWYVGVDGIARRTKRAYIGIGGTARRIRKAYIGVDGVAREFYRG